MTTFLIGGGVLLLYVFMAGFALSFWTGSINQTEEYPVLIYLVMLLWPGFILFALGTELGILLALSIKLSGERKRRYIERGEFSKKDRWEI